MINLIFIDFIRCDNSVCDRQSQVYKFKRKIVTDGSDSSEGLFDETLTLVKDISLLITGI